MDDLKRLLGKWSLDMTPPGGRTIVGRWEICNDGVTWEHDFDLTYRRVS